MTKEQYDKSIETGELQLTLTNKFNHYSIVAWLCFPSIFLLLLHLYKKIIGDPAYFADGEIEIIVCTSVLALLFYWLQKSRLKFKKLSINFPAKELMSYLQELCKEWDWTIAYHDNHTVIAKTNVSFFSGSWGEQVTVLFTQNLVLVNSICDLDKKSSLVSMGHNRENVKAVTDLIANINTSTNNKASI